MCVTLGVVVVARAAFHGRRITPRKHVDNCSLRIYTTIVLWSMCAHSESTHNIYNEEPIASQTLLAIQGNTANRRIGLVRLQNET